MQVGFREATRVWAKIGWLSFGGPAGQIALMHRELVEQRRWISESRFLHALNYCMLLPGPEAQQLAVYIGWLMHRTWGGIVAGTLFVLPGFLAILALSVLYASYQQLPLVAAIFFGLKAAIVAGAAVLGLVGSVSLPDAFPKPAAIATGSTETYVVDRMLAEERLTHTHPSTHRALRVLAICGTLWIVPVLVVILMFGRQSVFAEQALFFSQAAVVTFGGAYAVLAWVAQRAVESCGWLTPGEMLDGLALAETTPGPLIMVVQFVAFLAAFRDPSGLSPIGAAVLGSVLTVWVTFVPCFLWIFLGAPYVEALRANARLQAALSAITAAVVGVILSLAIWFAVHTIFGEVQELRVGPLQLDVPQWTSVNGAALALSVAAMVAVLRFKLGLGWVLGGCALLGALSRYLVPGSAS